MIDLTHSDDFWRFHMSKAGQMTLPLYLKMIELFTENGEVAGFGMAWPEDLAWRRFNDPLIKYLVKLMSDPLIKAQVLGDKLCGKIFYTSVGRFVVECIHYEQFLSQRQWTEHKNMQEVLQWSQERRNDSQAWRSLLASIGEKHKDDGFDGEFFERRLGSGKGTDFESWEKMVADWKEAADESLRKASEKHIMEAGERMTKSLSKVLDNVKKKQREEKATSQQAIQAWRMMDGRWAETEFERRLTIVRLQDRYPQIEEVARRMGRIAGNGNDRLMLAAGRTMKIEHSSGSDIDGITLGNDINAMLPSEAAMYMDDEMEDAFIYKFVRRRLQTFRYKSNISKPSRRLSFQPAKRKGPMIVCVDTSASMYGVPQRIVKSTLAMLEEIAESEQRDCFLIDFSVSIRAIDLMQRRREKLYESIGLSKNEYEFQRGELPFIGGGTSAVAMMDLMFELLDNGGSKYVNADVLWMSDFLIPFPDDSCIRRMKPYHDTGTRFYGMRIMPEGAKETEWRPYFDYIYPITYRQLRRY